MTCAEPCQDRMGKIVQGLAILMVKKSKEIIHNFIIACIYFLQFFSVSACSLQYVPCACTCSLAVTVTYVITNVYNFKANYTFTKRLQ